MSQPGNSKIRAVAREVARTGASEACVKQIWKKRQTWADWVSTHPGQRGKVRQRGQAASVRLLEPGSLGKRMPGKRGYLGPTDHCRQLVLPLVFGRRQSWTKAMSCTGSISGGNSRTG